MFKGFYVLLLAAFGAWLTVNAHDLIIGAVKLILVATGNGDTLP